MIHAQKCGYVGLTVLLSEGIMIKVTIPELNKTNEKNSVCIRGEP